MQWDYEQEMLLSALAEIPEFSLSPPYSPSTLCSQWGSKCFGIGEEVSVDLLAITSCKLDSYRTSIMYPLRGVVVMYRLCTFRFTSWLLSCWRCIISPFHTLPDLLCVTHGKPHVLRMLFLLLQQEHMPVRIDMHRMKYSRYGTIMAIASRVTLWGWSQQ